MKVCYVFKVQWGKDGYGARTAGPVFLDVRYGLGRSKSLKLTTTGRVGGDDIVSEYYTQTSRDNLDGNRRFTVFAVVVEHDAFANASIQTGPYFEYHDCVATGILVGVKSGGTVYTARLGAVYTPTNPLYLADSALLGTVDEQRNSETLGDYFVNLKNSWDANWEYRSDLISYPSTTGLSNVNPGAVDWLPAGPGGTGSFLRWLSYWPEKIDRMPSWLVDIDPNALVFRRNSERSALIPDVASVTPPIEVPEPDPTPTTVGGGDSLALENRLIAMQAQIADMAKYLNLLATRSDLLNNGKIITDAAVKLTTSLGTVNTNVVDISTRIPTTTRRLLETVGASLVAGRLK